jgi:hypothetical protein
VNSIDYRQEVEQATPIARPPRWPDLVAALMVVGVLFAMLSLRLSHSEILSATAPPPPVEIRMVEAASRTGLQQATIWSDPSRPIYLLPDPLLTDADLESAAAVEFDGWVGIELSPRGAGTRRLRQAFLTDQGKHLAILIDGEVRVAPCVYAQVGEKCVVISCLSPIEADRIVNEILQRTNESGVNRPIR